ncbi:uncharacterized protein LOC122510481 isoform X2 [Leptopilina heterotoma]|uniref:uncharacterized protein LOC122510481 isoform X2 n=1 Tax=Leptopilina heterotoma TaxID=63436 RepID=UPI001CA856CF|nr:uncharacterized protein LOC122510481 isoform X2 [Leptopilina heterotoma]
MKADEKKEQYKVDTHFSKYCYDKFLLQQQQQQNTKKATDTCIETKAIFCYDCVYCKDPFDPNSEYVRSCNGTFCSKTTRYYESENKTVVLARSCEPNITLGIPANYWKKYYCNKDFCNGTSTQIIAKFIFFFTISIQLLIL